ncbi:hypothetical protein G6O67_001398 [Ophiocordyceps sinensis]|uniref:Fido domain-containing protein n=2 Tax=Ophiocordyceps sinensis TaxID=72228 RepID=A0A8H4PX91_9HYPO|nr:Filamentation induced by cAMP/death on curing-related protein [Ophiocordyceps sinensis CO18]KAF4512231.1 hypothetical protein G6O67_001398 [Ophiocordyceps sinensis]
MNNPASVETIIAEARKESQREPSAFTEFWSELEKTLISLVYDSNLIESAGSSLRVTIKLCQDIFRGRQVSEVIDERDPEYGEHLRALIATHRKGDLPNVLRSRKEVINHAKALNYMIDKVILEHQPLSEELILEAHRILCENMNDDDVEPGQYRKHEVAVSYGKPGEKKKRSICMRASMVPKYMKEMANHLNDEIAQAEGAGELDPYTLAARYKHQFIMIHPFADGNGRMSRIILNVLLLRYAGHVAVFGSEGDEKDQYLAIVRRGAKIFNEEDMEVDFHEQTSHNEFARFLLTKSKASLEKMWNWASQEQG